MAHEESARRERSRSRSRRREASPRSPRRRSGTSNSRGRHSRSRSKTRSRSRSASASSSKDGRRHHHRRHHHADSRDKKPIRKHDESFGATVKDDGVEKKKRENREEVAHRSRMRTVVNSDDDEQASAKADKDRPSKGQDADGRKEERRHRRRRHRSRSPSFSESESSSSGSDSNSDSSSEDDRKHRKHKHKHKKTSKRRKKESKKSKTHKKDKKKRKSASGSSSHAVNQNEYGKYGILRESDFHAKSVSFQAWLREVKKMGEFNGPKWEAMELFQEYVEDYNTCTFPHEKYYDVEKYEMRRYAKQQRKALAKHQGAKDKALGALADEERVRRERREARERKEQEEFRLTLQMMDKDKIDAMRSQEHLRAQMQMHYKSGNVSEARRLEQMINKAEEDPRFKKR